MATSMQFCKSCSNMLYPKENRAEKKLLFVCKRCNYGQDADNPVVYRHELVRSAINQLENIPDDIISDVSLQRESAVVCPKCSERGAAFIQAKATPADDRMKLIFVCNNAACVHKWQG